MTITCIDSSALLRACFGEGDFSLVEAALASRPTTSMLAAVELPCAIEARVHRGELLADKRGRALDEASRLLAAATQIGISANVRRAAAAIAERFYVRALDAIHLGTAVVVERQQRRRGNVVRFCTADRRQGTIAIALFGAERVDMVPSLPPTPPAGRAHGTDGA